MMHITGFYQVCNILPDQSFPTRIEMTLTSKKPLAEEREIQSTTSSFSTYVFVSTLLHIANIKVGIYRPYFVKSDNTQNINFRG
jgi:hypothetical protein